jgi:hypothetical protein
VGGSGSGRWNHHEKRRTVEESWTLDVAGLPLNGPLSYPLSGTLKAIRITGSRRVLPVHYTLVEEDGRPILTLTYTPDGSSSAGASEERLGFITTKANFGGVRWWFACPLGVEGERCNRPVAKLYLPPQGRRKFGCRECHDLTYESSQESHAYDGLAARLAGGERSGEEYEALRAYFSKPAKVRRKRRRMNAAKEESNPSGLLEAFEKEFGLGEWS